MGNTLYWKFSFDHQRHVVFCTHNREELFMGESMEQARRELAELKDRLMAARAN
jgi:REP element-mobilizing transposase RayT